MPGSTSRDSHPRLSSADIVAVTTEMRLRQQGRKNRSAKGKDDSDDAKRELVMEEHKQSPAEVFAELGSDPVNGMTQHDVQGRLESEGLNRLTPPPTTPHTSINNQQPLGTIKYSTLFSRNTTQPPTCLSPPATSARSFLPSSSLPWVSSSSAAAELTSSSTSSSLSWVTFPVSSTLCTLSSSTKRIGIATPDDKMRA